MTKKDRIMSTDVQCAVFVLLKNKRTGMSASEIHAALHFDVALPRVTTALNEMRNDGLVNCDDGRPRTWFFAKNKPYAPTYISTPRVKRFDWTHETYVPPPSPALRAGALDYQRCKSVGTP